MLFIRFVAVMLGMGLMSGATRADIPKPQPLEMPPPIFAPPALKPMPPIPPVPKVRTAPRGSPGSWVTSEDYPPAALRLKLAGMVGVRLFIDPLGEVGYCQVTSGSGFDILDTAACDLLTERAEFTPARDGKGKATADVWASRFVWRIPDPDPQPLREGTGVGRLSISKMGVITDCTIKVSVPGAQEIDNPCVNFGAIPQYAALAMRGYGPEPLAEVDIEMTLALTGAARDKMTADKPGYDLRSLQVFRFEVDPAGKMARCAMERQKGSDTLINDFCYHNAAKLYVPGRDAAGAPVSTPVWIIYRILRKRVE